MALSKMKFVSIIGMLKHFEKVVSVLGYSGVFHPDDAAEFFSETEKFLPLNTKNDTAAILAKLKAVMAQAEIEPEIVDISGYNTTLEEIAKTVDNIENELGKTLSEKEIAVSQIKECKRKIEDSAHFVQLKLEIDKLEACEFVKVNFGRLPKDSYDKLSAYEENEYVQFFPCSSDEKYYWGVYTAPIDQQDEIDSIFSALYFEHIETDGFHGTATDFISRQKSQIDEMNNKIEQLDKVSQDYLKKNTDNILRIYSKLCEFSAFYTISNYAYRYNDNFVLVGWVPAENEKEIVTKLQEIESIEVSTSDAK